MKTIVTANTYTVSADYGPGSLLSTLRVIFTKNLAYSKAPPTHISNLSL